MLKGEQLAFRYSPKHPWIVRNFDLTIEPGEVVGLMGSSGFGKTTIAKLLSGYLPPVQGTVRVDDRPASYAMINVSTHKCCRSNIQTSWAGR